MSLSVIGFGVGRTGTFSLKHALDQLGFGPCHHMEEVDVTSEAQRRLWIAAAHGEVDWEVAYAGYRAAVDWPTAAFCSELSTAYPEAKFLLTVRDPERWYQSFSSTIALLVEPGKLPPELAPFLDMLVPILNKTGFFLPASKDEILSAYHAHVARVKALIPAERLLVYEVAQGWEPLCAFLDVPVPTAPFPRTNSTKEFWESAQVDATAAAGR